MAKALVLGAGGFIGGHMVRRLRQEGFWVRGVDLVENAFRVASADEFILGDLTDQRFASEVFDQEFDEVYQFAADMGGAGYIFTGEHDADIMRNSATINLNVLENARKSGVARLFYSSSACVYPQENQLDPNNPICSEDSAYPANPDSEYGWEKLFSERLFLSYQKQFGLNCKVARYHNIFGPLGAWKGGREKAPAALCRKVAEAQNETSIEIWGDGLQTRSFLFIEDCLEATVRLVRSDCTGPVNIGSEEMVTINQLAQMIIEISGKELKIEHIEGPQGVRGRTSDNRLIEERLGWRQQTSLRAGLEETYNWILSQVG